MGGIETPIKLETLGPLSNRGTSELVLPVSMVTSPGVPGQEGEAISSSTSECSEDEPDSEERPPTMMNWALLCERTRLT